ncbi:MAG: hypothetical protein GY865_14490 [candidate division Zixibacteria bacterium]|nr:hypothetical protein [candidate division Zixibacteria bacterium]
MLQKLFITILMVSLVVLIGGCSNNSTSGSTTDISEEFGGFKPSNEEPAFGSEVIASEMVDDTEFDDPMLATSEVDSVLADEQADIYALKIVWGQLRFDSTVTELTDWSGSLSISRGAEVVRRLIRFEPQQDYILERTERKLIEWVSYTTVHHDGIFVNIIIPKLDDTIVAEPVTVSFTTGPFEISFDASDMAAMDTVYYMDDSSGVAFHAFKVDRIGCPKGFLAGRWGQDEAGENIFYGRWMSHRNILKGHLRGTWGEKKFFGKYVDKFGQFEGLIKGQYHTGNSLSPNHNHSGWFRGHYYDANGNILGVLKGHYHENRAKDMMGCFFGRWRSDCGRLPEVDDGLDD